MDRIYFYLNKKARKIYGEFREDYYDHVFTGVNINSLNTIRKTLSKNEKILIIFTNDIVETIQPNILKSNPLMVNLLYLHLKNLSDKTNPKKNDKQFKKNQNLNNENYKYFNQKYSYLVDKDDIVIKMKSDIRSSKKFTIYSLFNIYAKRNNLFSSYINYDENYLFSNYKYIEYNKIMINELFSMKESFGEKMIVFKTYTDLSEFEERISNKTKYFEVNINDKIHDFKNKICCQNLTIYNDCITTDKIFNPSMKKSVSNNDYYLKYFSFKYLKKNEFFLLKYLNNNVLIYESFKLRVDQRIRNINSNIKKEEKIRVVSDLNDVKIAKKQSAIYKFINSSKNIHNI